LTGRRLCARSSMSVVVDCILVVEVDRASVEGISRVRVELGVLSTGIRVAPRLVPLDGWEEEEVRGSRYPIRVEIC
jgi:hypothetical protein